MPNDLTPAQRVALARHAGRPGTAEFIDALFTDFFEQRGDRRCADDGSIPGGIALFHGHPVTVIGHRKGRTLALLSGLTVPVVAVVTGEGGSGGALALGVGNKVLMLENAVYSVLSPEGFAAILWKDSSRSAEACDVMKLTAADLLELGVIDGIIPEPAAGAHAAPQPVFRALDAALVRELAALSKLSPSALAANRYKKFRLMGSKALGKERL